MVKQVDDWPKTSEELTDNDSSWMSKSEIKRDAEVLKKLGKQLVAMSKKALARIPLDEQLLTEIELAQRINREGQRRQLQLIGKLLRNRDIVSIRQALDKLNNRYNQQIVVQNRLEVLRDRLIEQGEDVITETVTLYPAADRQRLRQLVRQARREKMQTEATSDYADKIFHYLRQLTQQQ